MKKSDVQTHNAHHHGPQHPAVNVKVHSFARGLDVQAEFGCDEETAERALQFAFESAQSNFWETVGELAEHYLGAGVKVFSAGRSSGWLVVEGLPAIDSWDAIQLGKWARFEASVEADIAHRCKAETVRDDIAANRWAESGSEFYNFIDTRDGKTQCIAELKQAAIAAGFGAVVA